MLNESTDGNDDKGARPPLTKARKALRTAQNNSTPKALLVALALGLIGGALVSGITGLLKPVYLENQERDKQKYLLDIVKQQPGMEELFESVDAGQVEALVVDLATGKRTQAINPDQLDQNEAAQDPNQRVEIPPEKDLANIKWRGRYAKVYHVKKNDEIEMIILPVYGKGFTSTLRGYIGLAADANTVIALSFYDHAETPGLGARVDDPKWLQQWHGKKVRDPEGNLRIGVARGNVAASSPESAYQVDGLSGATWTSRSVTNLLQFWLGDYGFEPYLRRFSAADGAPPEPIADDKENP